MLKVVRFPNSHPIAIKVQGTWLCQRRCLFGRDSDGEAERSLGAPCGRLAGATRCVRTIRGVPTRDLSGWSVLHHLFYYTLLLSLPTCPPCHLPPARCLLCTHDRPWHPLLLVPFFQFHWLFLFGNPTDHFATILGHRLRFHGPHWLHRLLLFHRLSGPRDIINQLITTFINKLSPTKVSWSLPCSMIKDILTSGACLLFLAGQKMGKSCSPRSPVSSARTLDSRVRRGSSLSTMFALHQQWKI